MTAADARIARLEKQVDALLAQIESQETRIDALEEENAELKRKLAQNSSNSGKPPSSDAPADRAARSGSKPTGRPRGAQPGHKHSKRDLVPAAEARSVTDCFPGRCRGCFRDLAQRRERDPHRHQVWDLPDVSPVVDEYRLHRATCRGCGETTRAPLPVGVSGGAFGPGVLAMASMLVADGHMSRRKVAGVLRDAFGLRISLGALSEAEAIVSAAVAPAVEDAHQHALAASVKHTDGTSWSQAGAFRCVWVLATVTTTVFLIAHDATRTTLRQWITYARGVLVSDRGRQFTFWTMNRRQICWAHLIRTFVAFSEREGRFAVLGRRLLVLSRRLIETHHRVRDGTCARAAFIQSSRRIRARVERMLEEGERLRVRGASGSCRDILEHRDAMWTFVFDSAVEPTNNHAERELRGLVTWRKSSFGSQSERGNVFVANLKSVVHSCRKQQRNVLGFLRSSVNAALRNERGPALVPSR